MVLERFNQPLDVAAKCISPAAEVVIESHLHTPNLTSLLPDPECGRSLKPTTSRAGMDFLVSTTEVPLDDPLSSWTPRCYSE
jgi:hypothetical protein